jgi:cell division protein FtsZ
MTEILAPFSATPTVRTSPGAPIVSALSSLAPAPAVIKVLGLGGGGSNAVNRMIELGLTGVEFIAANTDAQALKRSGAQRKIQLGLRSTRGLGAGGLPEIGERAAYESRDEIGEALAGADMVFLTAGMGGGTGTGAIPVAAEVSRSLDAVTVAIVTTPFTFEGKRRATSCREGLERLRQNVDTLIAVPNDRLLQIVPKDASFEVACLMADDVLRQGVQGVAELVTRPGLVNVDFAHIRTLMKMAGGAYLAIGNAKEPNKALEAARDALNHPLLDSNALDEASGVLAHFTGGDDLSLYEINQAVSLITQVASADAEVVFGATVDPSLRGRAQVILIATGVGSRPAQETHNLWSAVTGAAPVAEAQKPAQPEEADVALAEAEAEPRTAQRPAPRQELDEPAFLRRRRALLYQK